MDRFEDSGDKYFFPNPCRGIFPSIPVPTKEKSPFSSSERGNLAGIPSHICKLTSLLAKVIYEKRKNFIYNFRKLELMN
jgi:hypothetical protein